MHVILVDRLASRIFATADFSQDWGEDQLRIAALDSWHGELRPSSYRVPLELGHAKYVRSTRCTPALCHPKTDVLVARDDVVSEFAGHGAAPVPFAQVLWVDAPITAETVAAGPLPTLHRNKTYLANFPSRSRDDLPNYVGLVLPKHPYEHRGLSFREYVNRDQEQDRVGLDLDWLKEHPLSILAGDGILLTDAATSIQSHFLDDQHFKHVATFQI